MRVIKRMSKQQQFTLKKQGNTIDFYFSMMSQQEASRIKRSSLKAALVEYATAWTQSQNDLMLPPKILGIKLRKGFLYMSDAPRSARYFVLPSTLLARKERQILYSEILTSQSF